MDEFPCSNLALSCPRNVVSIVCSFAGRGPSSSAAAWAAWPVLVPAAANGDLWMTFEWINKYQKSFKYHLSIIVYPFKLLVILEDRRWIKNWRHAKKYTETWEVLSITMFRYQRVSDKLGMYGNCAVYLKLQSNWSDHVCSYFLYKQSFLVKLL